MPKLKRGAQPAPLSDDDVDSRASDASVRAWQLYARSRWEERSAPIVMLLFPFRVCAAFSLWCTLAPHFPCMISSTCDQSVDVMLTTSPLLSHAQSALQDVDEIASEHESGSEGEPAARRGSSRNASSRAGSDDKKTAASWQEKFRNSPAAESIKERAAKATEPKDEVCVCVCCVALISRARVRISLCAVGRSAETPIAVSYTHLTLPTIA